MWPCQTHILVPLTELTGKCSFQWTPECQLAFKQMKALVSSDALLAFPDHTKPFDVETDASNYQLRSVIQQQGRPITYYSRKLNSTQHNYTTLEKELLSIIQTFKEFWTILLGSTIRVHMTKTLLTTLRNLPLSGFYIGACFLRNSIQPSSISLGLITFLPMLSHVPRHLTWKGRA